MFRYPLQDGFHLKLIEERHAEEFFELVDLNREHLREWLPWVDATTAPEDTREFIRKSLEQFAANEGFNAGIWYGAKCAGGIGFHKIDWINRKVEIGYWIAQEYQGKGVVSAACRALLDHAFHEWGLNRVEIRCCVGNHRSNRIAQRLGLKLDGALRDGQLLHGKFHDLNIYGMLARDWQT